MKLLTIATVVVGALILAGCASVVPTVHDQSSPSASTDRDAAIRGTEVCVQNNSSMDMRITWRGFDAAKPLPPAARQCNSGYETGGKPDVQATLEYEPVTSSNTWLKVGLWGTNPWSAPPAAAAWFVQEGKSLGVCGSFDNGQSLSFTTDVLAAQFTRNADTDDNKEFVLNLTNGDGIVDAANVTECVKEPSPDPL